MSATAVLRHAHLPHVTSFAHAQQLQQALVQQFLSHKALVSSTSRSPSEPPLPPPPLPTILTFTPTPVYTLGRREHGSLSAQQKSLLLAPLIPRRPFSHNPHRKFEYAQIEETQRGGQTTFHGPGQLVIYPIIDLKPFVPFGLYGRGLTVRSYVELLEQSTIDALAEWGINGTRTDNPGVWEKRTDGEEGMERKIAALGVHLRRNVTSYGVGLNIKTDLAWFDRIVACGLVGKGVTTMDQAGRQHGLWKRKTRSDRRLALGQEQKELEGTGKEVDPRDKNGFYLRKRLKPSTVGRSWVRAFARGLYGEDGASRIRKITGVDLAAEIEGYRGEEEVL